MSSFSALPSWVLDGWLFILGLCVGSFLNVVIARVPHEQSLVKPRSRCPKCGHEIPWYENIPLVSWLALRAKCSSCKNPISARYPAVELLTGLLFLACRHRFDWDYPLVPALLFVSLLIPLTFIDLEHWILPFVITIPGAMAGVLLAIPMGLPRLRDAAIGAGIAWLAMLSMEFIGEKIFKKEALGGGDKWLFALLGAFLTWKALLGVLFLASLQGSIAGMLMLAIKGRAGPAPAENPEPPVQLSDQQGKQADLAVAEEDEDDWEPGPTNLPFGPWLSLAGLEILLFGPALANFLPSLTAQLMGFR